MQNNGKSKSFLFLCEMCIAILFLAITCAVCVQMYAKAKSISNHSKDLSASVNICENIASLVKSNTSRELIAKELHGTLDDDGNIYVLYDSRWSEATENPSYIAKVYFEQNDKILNTHVSVERIDSNSDKELYELSVSNFIG